MFDRRTLDDAVYSADKTFVVYIVKQVSNQGFCRAQWINRKKHRKVLRAAFTKSANELDKLLSEETALQQVQVAWEVLLQKHENSLIVNREIYDTLLQEDVSEEDLMLEIDCCEVYDKKFIDLRITYGNRQKHVDIGLDEDDRRSRASLALSKCTLGPAMQTALQQVQVAWEVLLQKHENLLIVNREIYDTLLQEDVSEEDLMLEIDCCEVYDKKFIDLRITYGNRQKHVDIGLDEDDRCSRASLASVSVHYFEEPGDLEFGG
ncbi:hypothetical protein JTB14_019216 [Gonioctena quinquepunctata]|nr:hypothetical protein JTB14_019216 [Gonioctena quinquepunctata]